MSRKFTDYDLYVFDVDGTLYDQPKMRMAMALRLGFYYIRHPFDIKELKIISDYRKVKEHWDVLEDKETVIHSYWEKIGNSEEKTIDIEGMNELQCIYVAMKNHALAQNVAKVIDKWIFKEPLDILKKSKDDKLIEAIKKLKEMGKKIVILSDYPVDDKLSALELDDIIDYSFCTMQEEINEMKPSGKGLKVIESVSGCKCSDMIMIGDRFEKDGLCAQNAGVEYIILNRHVRKRKDLFV